MAYLDAEHRRHYLVKRDGEVFLVLGIFRTLTDCKQDDPLYTHFFPDGSGVQPHVSTEPPQPPACPTWVVPEPCGYALHDASQGEGVAVWVQRERELEEA